MDITRVEQLEELYGTPQPAPLPEEVARLTPECQAMVEVAPFFALATCTDSGLTPGWEGVRTSPDGGGGRRGARGGAVPGSAGVAASDPEPLGPSSLFTRTGGDLFRYVGPGGFRVVRCASPGLAKLLVAGLITDPPAPF